MNEPAEAPQTSWLERMKLLARHKWRALLMLVLVTLLLGAVLSYMARAVFVQDDVTRRPRVAVVVPKGSLIGQSIVRGLSVFVAEHNQQQLRQRGTPIELVEFDETAEAAQRIAQDARIVGVVGYTQSALLEQAARRLRSRSLPIVTIQSLDKPLDGVTSMSINGAEQGRFVGNYARNIAQQRLMYVIRQSGSEFDAMVESFTSIYARFETPVRESWIIDPDSAEDQTVEQAAQVIGKLGVGAVFVAADPPVAARIIYRLRASGHAIDFFGPAQLATQAFSEAAVKLAGQDASLQTHGIVAATPVLFDTANERAQLFQTAFQRQHGSTPDWVATVANDAMRLVLAQGRGTTTVQGVTGEWSSAQRQLELPIQMGLYNGERLISAPVQLLPIAKGVGFDYIEALKQGRVLYVNNRFMYKTNVVYVGTAVHEVSDINPTAETAMIDMSIWFRYRGSFSPQDLLITNAAEPFTLDKPEELIESSDIQYRRYRFRKKFRLNFTRADRTFNQQVAGITFRHRQLNRNNLTYVVDVLGMPAGAEFATELHQRNVITGPARLEIANAWMAQEQVQERGDGAPQYVGMTGEKALFSTITMGLLLKNDGLSARDLLPSEYFIYIGIIGFVGIAMAMAMDNRRWGRYWAAQSWVMRMIFVPLLLASSGNLMLDQVFLHAGSKVAGLLMLVYESIWWLMGAYLADMAVRRFVWTTLEERAWRQIPNIMKFLVSFLFLALAAGGITAFVLNQPLTSLLATSGVFAMVIGFAVQANIANIFSGILLNVERPFKVGDLIRVNNILGTVEDISWRTTRIKANDGQMISLANSRISEALTENLSNAPAGLVGETLLYVRPEVERGIAVDIIKEAIDGIDTILFKEPGKSTAPKIALRGLESLNGQWVATYSVKYRVATESKKSEARDKLWTRFGQLCKTRDISSVASSGLP
jgi:potassium efflux system protein